MLNVLIWLKKILFESFSTVIIWPLKHMALFVFRHVLIHIYHICIKIDRKVRDIWLPAKNKLLYPLSSKYVLHVVIIILTLLVTSNNIWASNVTGDTVGKDSLLYTMIGDEQSEDIIETAESELIVSPSTLESGGVVTAQQPETTNGTITNTQSEVNVITEGGALVKTNPSETSDAAKREGVITHKVAEGETISQIADNYNISTATILHANNLRDTDIIKPGQELKILPFSGVAHEVESGQTLEGIAKKYEIDPNTIIEYNKLVSADDIEQGQTLFIPGAAIPEPPAPPPPPSPKRSRLVQAVSDFFNPPETPKDTSGGWAWPAPTRKINQYSRLGHVAVDIDGDTGQAVRASKAGKVVTIGWGGGYGKHLILDHGNGERTLYAHLSAYGVESGEYVEKGQIIGKVGNTGWSTGPHLHFEIILGGRKVNPLSYIK